MNGVDPSADMDFDSAPNYADPSFVPYLDANCDGINDYFDFDLDSVPDFLDLDSDNDGIPDVIEAGGTDANGDGIIDGFVDTDANGLSDQLGAGLVPVDHDGDGLASLRDRDSDGDGIPDVIEAAGVDSNNDGIIDSFVDVDKDGYADSIDPTTNRLPLTVSNSSGKTSLSLPDTDGDGKRNFLDIDSDNDGITDNVEAQTTSGYIAPIMQDSDGDGIANVYDSSNGGTPIVPVNTDGTDNPDYLDTDSDTDGISDAIEGNDENSDGNPFPVLPVTGDSDNDGLLDGYDLVSGFNSTIKGLSGTGSTSPIQDTDVDGIRDWRDTDDDGDCILTSSTGVNGENTNANATWGDDFSQGGAPIPNYLFPTNNMVVTGANRCGTGTLVLTASSTSSGVFRWYDAASGGTLLRTSPSGSSDNYTTSSLSATTTFYVAFDNGTCVSTRKAVVASIVSSLTSPTVVSATRCDAGTLMLSASAGSNGTFSWYSAATGGTLLATTSNATSSTFTTSSIATTTTYYVEFSNGSCTTARAAVTATIATPPVVNVTPANTCGNSTVALVATATGPGTFTWYTSPSSTVILQTSSGVSSSSFTTPALSATTTFYVEYNNGGCSSARTPVTATVSSGIAAPSVTGSTICSTGTTTLSASYASVGTFAWYTLASGGVAVRTDAGVTSSSFTTPSISVNTDYYVEFSNGTCTSPRIRVTATVVSASLTTINGSRCGSGTVTLGALSTVAGTFRWYNAVNTLLFTSSAGITVSSYTTASLTANTTYYVELVTTTPACTSPKVAVTATIAPAVTLTVTNGTVCSPGSVSISATSGGVSGTFRWYTASVGGTVLSTTASATSSTFATPFISETVDYYVEFDQGSCITARVPVRAAIANTTDIAVTEATRCGSGTVTLLAAANITGTYNWYSAASGGTALSTSGAGVQSHSFTTPSISSTTTYYVDLTTASPACTSARVPVVATILPNAAAPTAINGSRCGTGTVTLAASSTITGSIRWYDAASGGNLLQTDNTTTLSTYTTPSIAATRTYYAEYSNGSCTSGRTAVVATVSAGVAPAPPTATAASRCGNGTISLSATSAATGTFRWYTAATGGTLLQTTTGAMSSSYITPALSANATYYVEFDNGTCVTSGRTAVTATINNIPSTPSIIPAERCGSGAVTLLATASSSGTFRWYDVATGGTLLQTTTAQTSSSYASNVAATTTFYVEFDNGTCTSSRVAAIATVHTVPATPLGVPASTCGAGAVNLAATSSSSGIFTWYDAATNGNLLSTSANTASSTFITPVIASTNTYYVSFSNGTCSSARTPVMATVDAAPNAPAVVPASRCGSGNVTLTATSAVSGTIEWYSASSGGSLLKSEAGVTTSSYITPSLNATQQYFVSFNNGSCSSTRVTVTATVNPLPLISDAMTGCMGNNGNGTMTVSASIIAGSLEYSINGTSYQASPVFSGLTNNTYTVYAREVTTQCVASRSNVTVVCNTPPVVSNKTISTNEDIPVTGDVIHGGDSDPDGTALVVTTTPVVGPSHGVIVLGTNGAYTYTPNLNYAGPDVVTFTVCDSGSPNPAACVNRTLTITINPVNDAPVANNDNTTTNEDTAVTFNITTNDTDVDGTVDVASVDLDPSTAGEQKTFTNASGTWMVTNAGALTYTPTLNFNGSASMTYTLNDNSGTTSNVATVTVTVTPVNDAPVANNDNATTNEDNVVTFNITTNDTDVDGTVDAASVDLDPSTAGEQKTFTNASGTWMVTNAGALTYTPTLNFNGSASMTYTLNDNSGATSNVATVTVTVTPVNDAPVANNDNSTTNEDTAVTFNITTNDTDVDGTVDVASVDLDPSTAGEQKTFTNASGTWMVTNAGALTYTPTLNLNGSASMTYTLNDNSGTTSNVATVTVTVTPVNDAPVANNDNATTNEDNVVTFNITTNDTDVDGTVDAASVDLDPSTAGEQKTFTNASGTWTVTNAGALTYTPTLNFNGSASMTYTLNDNSGATSNVATVTVTVTPVNDAPVANNDNATTSEDNVVTFNITTNDTDVDGTVDAASVDLDPSTAGEQKTFTNASGTWTVTNAGALTYTPTLNFNGPASFSYAVNDTSGATSHVATVTVIVTPVNDAPVANNDNASTDEDTPVSFSLTTNDTDVDGTIDASTVDLDPATFGVQKTLNVVSGNWGVDNAGTITFIPAANFTGVAALIYTVRDNNLALSNVATVSVTITFVNDSPVANNDSGTTNEDENVILSIITNDSDADGTIDLITIDLDPATPGIQTTITTPEGSWTVDALGELSFSPAKDFFGLASIDYVVQDDLGELSNTGIVTITVISVNDLPKAADDNGATDEDIVVSLSLVANDTDPDGTIDAATVDLDPSTAGIDQIVTNTFGSWSVNAPGVLTFSPATDFFGVATLTYTVKDNDAATTNVANITVTVVPVNDPPVAVNDAVSTNQGVAITIAVLTNDKDVDGSLDASSIDLDPSAAGMQKNITDATGTWTVSNDGILTFAPVSNFRGIATLPYTVSDNEGLVSNTTAVNVTIIPSNDPPVLTNVAYSSDEDLAVSGTAFDPADMDPEGTPLVVTTIPVDGPDHGTVTINTDGTFTYTPVLNYFGTDVFTVQICDSETVEGCAVKTVTITLAPLNDPPLAQNDTNTTTNGTPVTGTVATNDADVDGTLTYSTTPVSGPSHGSIVINANGTYTYTPEAGFIGSEEVTIEVCDNGTPALCTTANLTIAVTEIIPTPPVANADAGETTAGYSIAISVLANDVAGNSEIDKGTVDLDPATPGIQQTLHIPGKGTLTVDANGIVTFTPQNGFTGLFEFEYSVAGINGSRSNATTVSIMVKATTPEGVVIPNAFSPNNDGENDYFVIEGVDQYSVSLYIYNRWGNIVYENRNYKNNWSGNGTDAQDPSNRTKISAWSSDKPLPDGTYFFIVEFPENKGRATGFIELRR